MASRQRPTIDGSALGRAAAAVDEMARRREHEARLAPYAERGWDGGAPGRPVLQLDDFSELPFLDDISGVEHYQHRARLRAGDGDLFAAVVPPALGYEEYSRDRLGLGSPRFVGAAAAESPLAVAAACAKPEPLAAIARRARAAGALDIEPFMGIEAVWSLAAAVAAESGVPVRVVAPPPPATWIANDKEALAEVVRRVLGDGWLVETLGAADPATLAAQLLELAGRHPQVALKRLRCASGMGNLVLDANELVAAGAETTARRVTEFLERTEWDGREWVQAVAWEETTISPSTQLWIPPRGHGSPRLDGVYEQILEGERRVFAGSRPSTLPAAVDRRLGEAALAVAAALQRLGYVGRCSFDHLLLGDPAGDFELRFVECNGRWGGTSLPMHLVDRLCGDRRPPYRAQDFVHPGLVGASFPEVLACLGDELFDHATRRGRYVLYNVGPLAEHGKLDVIALGETQEEAEAALGEELPRRLGL